MIIIYLYLRVTFAADAIGLALPVHIPFGVPMAIEVNPVVFNIFFRFMINAAKNKRLVPYHELENIFGFSHNIVGMYAGNLGHFCYDNGYPLLNSIIVNASNPKPAHGYDEWVADAELEIDWSEEMFKCFKRFHVPSDRQQQTRHFSGMNDLVKEWFYEE